MSHNGFERNEYGTLRSKHTCPACRSNYTATPAIMNESYNEPCGYPPNYDHDGDPGCPGYDPAHDVLKLLENGAELRAIPDKTGDA